MTGEEAKSFLIDISYKLGNMAVEYLTEKDGEKMREAIEVLEQQPSEEDFVKHKKEVLERIAKREREIDKYIKELEALKQQPCEDCISREAVDDAIYDYSRSCDVNYEQIMEFIDKLPSVTPKYTDEEIDKAQAVEQAYVDKMKKKLTSGDEENGDSN